MYKILLVLIGICVFYILLQGINGTDFSPYTKTPLNSRILILGSFIYMGLLFLVSYIVKFLNKKICLIISSIFLIAIFIGLIVGGHIFRIEYSYDIHYLHTTASEIASGKKIISTLWYFDRYPHQWHAALFLSVFYSIGNFFGLRDSYQLVYFISYIFVWFSALFSWLSIRKVLGEQYAVLFLFAFLVNPILYMYASYCYTDVLCMPFMYSMIYIAITSNKTFSNEANVIRKNYISTYRSSRSYLFLVLSGFLAGFGFFIRATNIIPAIAILILLLLNKDYEKKLKKIVSFIFGICIIWGLLSSISHLTDPGLNKDAAYPIEHWIAMGTDDTNNGRYSVESEKFTHSFEKYDEKVLNTRLRIWEHIDDIGFKGMTKLISRKMIILWTDGTNDMRAYFQKKNYRGNMVEYVIGDKQIILRYFYQFARLVLLMAMLITLLYELKKTELDEEAALWISFFGVCLFYSFWEVMSRYSMSFIPMLIMLEVIGIGRVFRYRLFISNDND
jgi:hypothetical protein